SDVGNAGIDALQQLSHDPIDRRQEQGALAWEITIQGAFADLEPVGQELGIGAGVTVVGEKLDGSIEDFFAASAAEIGLLGPAWFSSGGGFHDASMVRTDQSVRLSYSLVTPLSTGNSALFCLNHCSGFFIHSNHSIFRFARFPRWRPEVIFRSFTLPARQLP